MARPTCGTTAANSILAARGSSRQYSLYQWRWWWWPETRCSWPGSTQVGLPDGCGPVDVLANEASQRAKRLSLLAANAGQRIHGGAADQPFRVPKRLVHGWLALQVHVGPPMRVQFKDIYLRRL